MGDFIKKSGSRLLLSSAFCFSFAMHSPQALFAQGASPPTESPDLSETETDNLVLNLEYVDGGDFVLGQSLDEGELIKAIRSHVHLETLKLSGQDAVSPAVMATIQADLPQLKKLELKGYIRFIATSDGRAFDHESVNWQDVTEEMLQALFKDNQEGVGIEVLDLSLSTVDDNALKEIGAGAHNLRELYLRGSPSITDAGILDLVAKLPNLKLIDLSKVVLKAPFENERIAAEISSEVIQELKNRGVLVIENERTPWF